MPGCHYRFNATRDAMVLRALNPWGIMDQLKSRNLKMIPAFPNNPNSHPLRSLQTLAKEEKEEYSQQIILA
jgi:hypothetical protein